MGEFEALAGQLLCSMRVVAVLIAVAAPFPTQSAGGSV